jgi:hypothetical protein
MDPAIEGALLGAIVGAVLGVLGTYVFDVRQAENERAERERVKERERKRHRETIATALLQDLRRMEFELREIYDRAQPSRIALSRPPLLYDALKPEIRWFASSSVQSIAEFYRRVDHLYSGVEVVRASGGGTILSTPQREYEIRAHAAFALLALPDAFAALQSEGGTVPGPIGWVSSTFPTLPSVPEPIFDDTAERLAKHSPPPAV